MKNIGVKQTIAWCSAGGLVVIATYALAQAVPPRTLDAYSFYIYTVVVVVCAAGGALTNAKAYLEDDKRPHQWLRLLVDVLQAQFYGFAAFFSCKAASYDELVTMVVVLAAAYSGTGFVKFLFALRKLTGQS